MSAVTVVAVAAALAALVLVIMQVRLARRLGRVEERARGLEDLVRSELAPGIAAARVDARAAAVTAREAALAAGVEEARPPRLLLEPVTGPVVRAVAIGASARKMLVRVAAPWSRRRDLRSSV